MKIPESPARLEMVTQFLDDLAGLCSDLDLTVVGYHPRHKQQWKGLEELTQSQRTGSGRDWLDECTLRIYAPADWLIRWRYFFSKKLGFRWIPSSVDDLGPGGSNDAAVDPDRITTGAQVRSLLKDWGWTQQDLADALTEILGVPVSRRRVLRHIKGESETMVFFDAVTKLRGQHGEEAD